MEINFENFIKFNIQVGTIVDVKENKKASQRERRAASDFLLSS